MIGSVLPAPRRLDLIVLGCAVSLAALGVLFIASTAGDNTNLVIAQIAQKRFGVSKTIVRVMDPARADWYNEQGLQTISPTKHAIEMFERALVPQEA